MEKTISCGTTIVEGLEANLTDSAYRSKVYIYITAAEPYSVEQQPNTVKNTNTVRTQNAMNSETWREI